MIQAQFSYAPDRSRVAKGALVFSGSQLMHRTQQILSPIKVGMTQRKEPQRGEEEPKL